MEASQRTEIREDPGGKKWGYSRYCCWIKGVTFRIFLLILKIQIPSWD
jgi:hypothetical protein